MSQRQFDVRDAIPRGRGDQFPNARSREIWDQLTAHFYHGPDLDFFEAEIKCLKVLEAKRLAIFRKWARINEKNKHYTNG